MNTSGAQYANGASCTQLGTSLGAYTCMFDARSGQMLAQQNTVTSGSTNVVDAHVYSYDAAGRQTADAFTAGSLAPVVATRGYDSDSHIISQNIPRTIHRRPVATRASCSTTRGQPTDISRIIRCTLTPIALQHRTQRTGMAIRLLYVAFGGVMALYVEKLGFLGERR